MDTKKREANKTKKEMTERSLSKKVKKRTSVVKKTATKTGRKIKAKNIRKKTERS